MAGTIADFFGADLPAIQQEMLRQRQMMHGDPGTNIPAPASPETLQNMQRALPPGMPPMTPPTPATGQGFLADMGAAAGGPGLPMPPQAPAAPLPQPQGGGMLDGMQNFIVQNRGALAGLGAAIQQGRPVGYGVLQGQELDKKRKEEEDQKTADKNFADATAAFIKDPQFQAMVKADPRKASEMLRLYQADIRDKRDYNLQIEKFGYEKSRDAVGDKRWDTTNSRADEELKLRRNADARAQAEADKKPGDIIKDIETPAGKTSVLYGPSGIRNLDGTPYTGAGGAANPYYQGNMNADQAKSATFADRMANSHALINNLDTLNSGVGGQVGKTVSDIGGSWLTSNDRQKLNQAQQDFVNAVLRKESGAVISSSEFANAEKQYFPQPGEGPEIIAQKKANREAALAGIAREAGPNYRPSQMPGGKAAASRSSAIDEAKAAIAKGAPPDAVKTRLLKMGVPQSELNF